MAHPKHQHTARRRQSDGLNIVTRLNDNSFTWDSVNREIDGEFQPNADPVVVVRKLAQ